MTTFLRLITAISLALLSIEMWHVARAAIDFHTACEWVRHNKEHQL